MAPELDTLTVGDEPESWRQAGFTVDDDGTCAIGAVRLAVGGRDLGKGIRAWSLRGIDESHAGDVEGMATTVADGAQATPATHPNGAVAIDHVVLLSPDVDRTVGTLAGLGLEPRLERRTDTYGAPMRQLFFRLGEPVLELIGGEEPMGDGPCRVFGLALTVDDLDAAADLYGDHLGRIKDAVQEGRRIATLRHKELDLSVAIAFMTPEP